MGGVSVILTSESICKDEVRWTATSPSPTVPGRLEVEYESVPVSFLWVFFTLFCNKSGNSGEKDYNLCVPSIHPDKTDWITGVWLLECKVLLIKVRKVQTKCPNKSGSVRQELGNVKKKKKRAAWGLE